MQFTEETINTIVRRINKKEPSLKIPNTFEEPTYKIASFNKEDSGSYLLEDDYFDKLKVLIFYQATKLKNGNFIIANKRSLLNTLFISSTFHLMRTIAPKCDINISLENYHGTIAGMHLLTSEKLPLDKIYIGHTDDLSELALINLE
jgi:hypothetical protein